MKPHLFTRLLLSSTIAAFSVSAQTSSFPTPVWLEVQGVSNNALNLVIHGTAPTVTYQVLSKSTLTSPVWTPEFTLLAAAGANQTFTTVPLGSHTNGIFLQVRHTGVTGLKLWLAADLSFKGGTNLVSGWADQSGNTNDAVQAGVSARPLYVTNAINGLPVIRFDGVNDQLVVPYLAGTNNFTAFIVARTASGIQIDAESNTGVDGGGGQKYLLFDNKSLDGQTNFSGAGLSMGTNGLIAFEYQWVLGSPDQVPPMAVFPSQVGTNVTVTTLAYAGRQPKIYMNGVLVRTGLTSTRANVYAPREIGGDGYGYFQGDIAEVLMFDHTLSDVERGSVETYLDTKYGVPASLPSSPTNLLASAVSSSQINLVWLNSAANAQGFLIERKAGSGGTYQQVASVSSAILSHLDTGLLAGTNYYYRIRAFNSLGDSGYSNETNATTSVSGAPLPLADLKTWYEADAGSLLTINGQVYQWLDQSGSANDAIQFTSANEPLFVAGQLNGRPVVRFDGLEDRLLAPYVVGTNNFTIFVVAATGAPHEIDIESSLGFGGDSGEHYVLAGRPSDGTATSAELSMGTNGVSIYEYQPTSIGPDVVAAEAVYAGYLGTGAQIMSAVYTNKQPLIYLNGTLVRTGLASPRAFVVTPQEIGGDPYGYFQGDVAEIMIFNRQLSNAELLTVGNYLNGKYAVVPSLPAPPPAP